MQPGTREFAYYMAQCYDIHIAYELATNGDDNPRRIQALDKKYNYWSNLHNSFPKTTK